MHQQNGTAAADGAARALEEYLAAVEAGTAPPREEFLACHPELAEDLDACLAALRFIGRAAGGPLSAAGGGEVLPLAEQAPGQLGDFRLIREVGRGGMGVVYEAEQISLGRRVALKVLPFAATMDPRALQRFQNEARAAASLDHPHIVHVHAVGCERAVHFYAMQFIDGQTLAATIADLRRRSCRPVPTEEQPTTPHVPGQPAPPAAETAPQAAASTERTRPDRAHYRRAAEWGIQAAEALDCAHALGVVHRDVKPANLLVDAAGRLWVTDFGLAQVQSDTRVTMSGDLVGTLRYMSPEQALARRVVIDHRTDVYSLGATLYELLTLEPAFRGGDRQELLRQIAFEEPTPPRRINKAIPAELETIVLKAMKKNPADRYATAKQLADDLGRFLRDEPIRAKRPGLLARGRKWARRHQAVVWSAALIALILAASVGWVLGDRSARRREAEGKVVQALDEAGPRLRLGNPWDPALTSAAQRAGSQLDGGLLGRDSRRRVEQLQKDVHMLAELERIRLLGAQVKDEHFDTAARAAEYGHAFREYGIDVGVLGPKEVAARVQDSAIREPLVAALDDWAHVSVAIRGEEDRQAARQLLAAARQADPDPWRNRLRELSAAGGTIDLRELALTAPVEELPAATLGLLGAWVQAQALGGALVSGPTLEVLRRAHRRFPADFWINHALAAALAHAEPPQLEEAIGFYRAAVAVRPQSPGAYLNLGNALRDKGDTDGAIAEYREAIRLKPDYAAPHNNLGNALRDKGDTDGAIAEYREAIRLKKNDAHAYQTLGLYFIESDDVDGAIATYRELTRLEPDSAVAHGCLAGVLRWKGELAEALIHYRRCHELGSQDPCWRWPSAQWVEECERLAELEPELPAILSGALRPQDARQRADFADLCSTKHLNAAAARLYQEAIAASPDLLGGPGVESLRYRAACAAAQAGCGKGEDAAKLSDAEHVGLRRQALNWLRRDLDAWNWRLDRDPDEARPAAAYEMQKWLLRLWVLFLLTYPQRRQAVECFPAVEARLLNPP
jgi:serine/threonine protein kinase/Flp pilus assembly protein TadD